MRITQDNFWQGVKAQHVGFCNTPLSDDTSTTASHLHANEKRCTDLFLSSDVKSEVSYQDEVDYTAACGDNCSSCNTNSL